MKKISAISVVVVVSVIVVAVAAVTATILILKQNAKTHGKAAYKGTSSLSIKLADKETNEVNKIIKQAVTVNVPSANLKSIPDDISSIILKVEKIQFIAKSGRIQQIYPEESSALISVDLLNLGSSGSLFDGSIKADIYLHLQLFVKEAYMINTNGNQIPLKIPSGYKIEVDEMFNLTPHTDVTIMMNINVNKSIVTGSNKEYVLKPILKTTVVRIG